MIIPLHSIGFPHISASMTKESSTWKLFQDDLSSAVAQQWNRILACGQQIMRSLWDAAQLLFLSCLMQVSPVTMSHLSPRTAAPPCLPLNIKDSLKEHARLFGFLAFWLLAFGFLDVGGFWKGRLLEEDSWRGKNEWLREDWREKDCWKEMNHWRRIAKGELLKLRRTWDGASLSTGTLRVMHTQFVGAAVVVCKSEHRGCKKAKERTWHSASLGAKTLREIMLKKS
jgi:hypothetical protein